MSRAGSVSVTQPAEIAAEARDGARGEDPLHLRETGPGAAHRHAVVVQELGVERLARAPLVEPQRPEQRAQDPAGGIGRAESRPDDGTGLRRLAGARADRRQRVEHDGRGVALERQLGLEDLPHVLEDGARSGRRREAQSGLQGVAGGARGVQRIDPLQIDPEDRPVVGVEEPQRLAACLGTRYREEPTHTDVGRRPLTQGAGGEILREKGRAVRRVTVADEPLVVTPQEGAPTGPFLERDRCRFVEEAPVERVEPRRAVRGVGLASCPEAGLQALEGAPSRHVRPQGIVGRRSIHDEIPAVALTTTRDTVPSWRAMPTSYIRSLLQRGSALDSRVGRHSACAIMPAAWVAPRLMCTTHAPTSLLVCPCAPAASAR